MSMSKQRKKKKKKEKKGGGGGGIKKGLKNFKKKQAHVTHMNKDIIMPEHGAILA